MTRPIFLASILACALTTVAAADNFPAECAALAGKSDDFALKGVESPWLFLTAELTHLGKDEFWKSPVPAVNAMASFQKQLAEKGVQLLVVPVPAKAAIYPDKLMTGSSGVRPLAPFLALLKEAGLKTVDLDTAFRTARLQAKVPLYCATDAHWSPAGIAMAAGEITKALKSDPALAPLLKGHGPADITSQLKIKGDLTAAASLQTTPAESLTVTWPLGTAGKGSKADPAAPIVLLGDSHTMVFTDGESLGMHCEGGGLREHLEARLGASLAQISNQNSGGDGARRLLRQRELSNPDYWKDRKLVIWVFSEREFTAGKWR